MVIVREFVYPDLIKYWDDNGVVATVNRQYIDVALRQYFEGMGDRVIDGPLSEQGECSD